MKKHAYLIIAHSEPEILKILLSMLDDDRNDIYLHIDKKSRVVHPNELHTDHAQLFVLKERIDIRWMDISQVKAELLLFNTAFNNGPYAYYHLLSGVDLPIKSQDYIHRFCEERSGAEFVTYAMNDWDVEGMKRKITKYHILCRWHRTRHGYTKYMAHVIRKLFLCVQDFWGYSRKEEMEFRTGSNWLSVTDDFVRYLLSKRSFILKRFRWVPACDEIFVQTVLWNSPFRNNIYTIDGKYRGNLHEIDWKRGWPYVWKETDLEELLRSDKMFARKFSSADMNIVHKIKQHVDL